MEIVARLKNAYGADQPILLEEVKAVMSDYSTPHVFRFIKSAIESEELIRYDESETHTKPIMTEHLPPCCLRKSHTTQPRKH